MSAPPAKRVALQRVVALQLLASAIASALAACATVAPHPGQVHASEAGLAGWQALGEGRTAEADRTFERALAAEPRDAVAQFGRACLAYERGASETAADLYASTLAALADGASPFTHPLCANTWQNGKKVGDEAKASGY